MKNSTCINLINEHSVSYKNSGEIHSIVISYTDGEYFIVKKREKIEGLNIFDHNLVPQHEIMKPKEVEALLKKYHIQPYLLPFIKISDPAIEEIEAKIGDVIRITRKSPTSGDSIVYRYVVEG